MNRFVRVLRLPALALIMAVPMLVVGAAPAPARQSGTAASLPPSALPPLPPQTDPWLYRGSDVPHDRDWTFGTLPNGLRWAVRNNQVPPGQVSIRIRIDAGAMHERKGEEGFAHLLEHLVFRQSKYLGQAQAIPTWQRLGATFGSDTNAETTPTQTVFKIDLPDATPQTLDESFQLLSGMMIAPVLSEANIRAEAPIVLAEKRERGGAAERVVDGTRWLMAAGQPLADHATIGSVESITGAHEASVNGFHQRWYRPENAVIVVSGDADPRLMAALIQKWFGDWPAVGAHTPAPDFGAPVTPPGGDPAWPFAGARVLVEPTQSRKFIFGVVRPWKEKLDTIVYNQGLMLDMLAQLVINRRLEAKARAGGSFLSATVDQQSESRSVEGTFVLIAPMDGDWKKALHDVRSVIAEALDRPPTTEEVAREVAEINVIFESQVQQRALLPGARVADDLIQAVDIHETVASPTAVLDIFRRSVPQFTPAAVHAHAKALFTGKAVRALYITPQAGEADEASLRAAMQERVAADAQSHVAAQTLKFADLPALGQPGPMPQVERTGLLGIEQMDLGNGVAAQIWPTRDDPGRVTVKVRFGAGYRAFTPATAPYAQLGDMALVPSGFGVVGQNDIDRLMSGRKMGYDFRIEDGYFQFSADTRDEDLADQLYLFAAKLAQPRWDASPVARAKAAAVAQYTGYDASPGGVLARDLRSLQRGGDQRFAPPSPSQLQATSLDGFRQVWGPLLASGPVEVQIFGDFDRAKGIEALRRTFGALPPRGPLAPDVLARDVTLAAPSDTPVVLHHKGDANQAAAVISWPTGAGVANITESRQLEVLSQVFANRLMEALREKAGASYAPQVASDWPLDLPSGGTITALAQLQPDMVPQFFATADKIARDLAAQPLGPDEMARVMEPLRQQISRASSSTAFFMSQIEGATQERARYAKLRSLYPDYTQVSPQVLQQLAQRYLVAGRAWRLAVLPQGGATPVGR
ncbi:insulinase family protein [Novosphingobium sp. FSY-8]|uniref:Insulinase family protein n=1 Tax=Novosphingobium ovatum TaxID=1908523 RepID=A0ABW9XBK0_9SPHN|nr:M16 family metallopeptidase [Novosphingobium ovatum]NBC35872.1 insulinase family protein [Novosphingobium ovatum]